MRRHLADRLRMQPTLVRKGLIGVAVVLASLFAGTTVAAPARPPRVAIIVGPVGAELTPLYLDLAELAATEAERRGATVARAYSPNATPDRVIAAVDGADVIVYFGHGTGYPNPYASVLNTQSHNGWALQGPNAHGTHADGLTDGTMRYYGEAWLEANLHPAPGFVMIYSNACYAAGASEGWLPRPSEEEALAHVANYSRPILAMGASAYYATDFYAGAATLIAAILARPTPTAAQAFASDSRYEADAVTRHPHPAVAGAEVWLHRSRYFEGELDYWYAFAGTPEARPSLATRRQADSSPGGDVPTAIPNLLTGQASSYPFTRGYQDEATVALPFGLTNRPNANGIRLVAVCADRCAVLRVVDTCDCYWGTPDQRIVNLSHAAWSLISDAPLAEGLIQVRLYLDAHVPQGEAARPLRLRTDSLPPGTAPPAEVSLLPGQALRR